MTRRLAWPAAISLALWAGAPSPALAVEAVTPPAMYPPDTWEGRSAAVVRVLDRLDAKVETLTVPAGSSASYKSLTLSVRACLQHPAGLPPDSAASLAISDGHAGATAFDGWMYASEPFVAVFQSPVYGVQLVSCGGAAAAPAAPPLPPPIVPPALQPGAPPLADPVAGPGANVGDPGAAPGVEGPPASADTVPADPVYPAGPSDPSAAPDPATPPT